VNPVAVVEPIWYLSCDASRVRITGILANSL
jgi:hypothetical protein